MQRNEAVLERKARAIYQALNRGDPKNATKLCNQALAKFPRSPLLTILKAYSHERAGSLSEALRLTDDVISMGCADEEVLHHASTLLRSHGQYERLLRLYEAAVSHQPQDLGLVQEVFLAHVRLGNLVNQQQVATRLSKAAPQEVHTFWVVCSMLSQAEARRAGAPGIALTEEMLLRMAAGLMQKQLEREGMLSYDALMLYMDVLQGLGRGSECEALLEGPSSKAVHMPQELLRLKVQVAIEKHEMDKAAALLKESLTQHNADDWAGYMLLFACCLPSTALPLGHAVHGLMYLDNGFGRLPQRFQDEAFWKDAGDFDEDALKTKLADLDDFVASIIAKGADGALNARGPYLARVELAWRRLKLRLASAQELAVEMLRYFQRFSTKLVAHEDLRCYATRLPEEAAVWLTSAVKLEAEKVKPQVDAVWTLDKIRVTVNVMRLSQYLGSPRLLSADAALEHARLCMSLYASWRPTMNECDVRELGIGEDVADLAILAIVEAARRDSERQSSLMMLAATFASLVALERPYSPMVRMARAALHSLMGDSTAVLQDVTELSLRQVQLDTLAHHSTPTLAAVGPSDVAIAHFKQVHVVRQSHSKASRDALADCYTRGSFSKVLEFLAFKRHGSATLAYVETRLEGALTAVRRDTMKAMQTIDGKLAKVSDAIRAAAASHLTSLADVPDANDVFVSDDLAQRPVWFPPDSCPCTLASLEWWESAAEAQSTSSASGSPWWRSPEASRSSDRHAQAWRSARRRGVSARQQQPALLTAGLLLDSSQEQALHAMEALLTANETTWREVEDWHGSHAWPRPGHAAEGASAYAGAPAASDTPGYSTTFRMLHMVTLGLGIAVREAWACSAGRAESNGAHGEDAAPPTDDSLATVIERRAAMVVDLTSWLVAHITYSLRQGSLEHVFVAGTTLQSLLLLLEHDLWLLACFLQVWVSTFSGARQGKNAPHLEHIMGSVRVLAEGTKASCEALRSAVQQNMSATGTSTATTTSTGVCSADLELLQRIGSSAETTLAGFVAQQRTALKAAVTRLDLYQKKLALVINCTALQHSAADPSKPASCTT